MSNLARRITARKVLLFAVLLLFIAAFSISNATQPVAASEKALICCSACESENPPPPCRHGCSPSCK